MVWDYNAFIMLTYLGGTPCLKIRSKSVFQLTESNAALRSKKTAMVGRQNMFLCSKYWRKVKIWTIQPRPGLNPACCSRIWFSLAAVRLCRIIKVSSLVMTGVRMIPLWFSHTVFPPFLKIESTVVSPQLSGTDSDCQILSNNWVITLMRVMLPVLNSAGDRSSGPVALLSFNHLIASPTSVSVGGSLDTVQTETGSVYGWESGWGC